MYGAIEKLILTCGRCESAAAITATRHNLYGSWLRDVTDSIDLYGRQTSAQRVGSRCRYRLVISDEVKLYLDASCE